MSFRFRRTFSLIPGLKLNIGKKSASIRFGVRGIGYTIGTKGARATIGLPGTGLSYTTYSAHQKPSLDSGEQPKGPVSQISDFQLGQPSTPSRQSPINHVVARIGDGCVEYHDEKGHPLTGADLCSVVANRRTPFDLNELFTWLVVLLGPAAFLFLPMGFYLQYVIASGVTCALLVGIWFGSAGTRLHIDYELSNSEKALFESLVDGFRRVAGSRSIWQVLGEARIAEQHRKWHSGVGSSIDLAPARIEFGGSQFFGTSLLGAALRLKGERWFFLPDGVLIEGHGHLIGLSYKDMTVTASARRFVEAGRVPSDATVVGATWKYVNKNGSPDRRFKNNVQISVCLYETIAFESNNQRRVLELSKGGVGSEFLLAAAPFLENRQARIIRLPLP